MPNVLITGCDRGLGLALAQHFAEHGWRVFAGSYLTDWPELAGLATRHPNAIRLVPIDIGSDDSVRSAAEAVSRETNGLDLVVNNAAVSSAHREQGIREGQEYDDVLRLFDVNALGALRITDAFLPLLRADGGMRRLCYVSSEAGSIERCRRVSWYAYCMSKAALNRGVWQLFHELRPEGFTFRLFHPGWMRTYMSGTRNDGAELEPGDVAAILMDYCLTPIDEDRLVLRDWQGNEWPW